MNNTPADTLVFFGATVDLAFKKLFLTLQGMVLRGVLNVPVVSRNSSLSVDLAFSR